MDATRFNRAEQAILWIMRLLAVSALFALPAVFLPFSWMFAIHEWLGLGELPDAKIVRYLARSLSAFYVVFGAQALFVSSDIRRYRDYIRVWGCLVATMGVMMLGIDLEAGMPLTWTLGEGPPLMLIGAAVVALQPFISRDSER